MTYKLVVFIYIDKILILLIGFIKLSLATQLKRIHFKYIIKIWFRSILGQIMSLLFLSLFITSCSDQGCIDAEDFGEYKTQTLTVLSNVNGSSCNYDSTLTLNDPSQGSGLKTCFTTGQPSIVDENGNSAPSIPSPGPAGCYGLQKMSSGSFSGNNQAEFVNLCVQYCIAQCNQNASTVGNSAEPAWQPTLGDGTMTITPLSQVLINVSGNVVLGNNSNLSSVYVRNDNYALHSLDNSWNNLVIDVKSGQTRTVNFSGQWVRGAKTFGGNPGANNANLVNIANGARALAAYVIPAPDGYGFNYSYNSDTAGAVGVPLLPDRNTWGCTYSGGNNTQSTCQSDNYSSTYGYSSAIDSNATLSLYNITSASKAANLSTVGGMIRWDGDGLNDTSYDPFTSNHCDSGNCGSITAPSSIGKIVGNLASSNVLISNPNNFAVSTSFRPLLSGASCNFNLAVAVVDSNQNQIYSYTVPLNNVSWSDTGGAAVKISLEAGDSLVITQDSHSYVTTGAVTNNCGNAIAVRFLPYQDIQIQRSGMINLKTLGGTSGVISGSCNVVARIINPQGNRLAANGITADFYEYGDFNTSASDPFDHYNVLAAANNVSGLSAGWGTSVFVRNGQIIRFAPESWVGTWNSDAGARRCGIGMAMSIAPRPALLCRGYASDAIPNPNCTPDYSTGSLTGCVATSINCVSTANTSASFCPSTACQPAINCTNGDVSNSYTKTNCTYTAWTSGTFTTACPSPAAGVTYSTCNSCANEQANNAEQPALQSQLGLIQCYDLENYRGKVANIDSSTGFAIDGAGNLVDPNAKGALKLSGFNGKYGNFANYAPVSPVQTQNSNTVYTLSGPLIFSQTGRLKFMVLSGNDFLNLGVSDYTGNSNATGSSYTGQNGYRVDFSGQLNFSNGAWLETVICQESSNSSSDCAQISRPNKYPIDTANGPNPGATDLYVPKVVELTAPSVGNTFNPTSVTSFQFDDFGSLIRINNPSDSSVTSSYSAAFNAMVPVGSNFYVHDYMNISADKLSGLNSTDQNAINRLRLTFKIRDPEIPGCVINGSAIGSSNNGITLTNPGFQVNNCKLNNSDTSNTGVLDDNGDCNSNSANIGATCGVCEAPTSSNNLPTNLPGCSSTITQCLKQYYCGNIYSDNSGQYTVTVSIKDPNNTISNIVSAVIQPVITIMDGSPDGTKVGQAQMIYTMLISDPRYQAILTMSIVLMFVFYGLGYLMGVSELTHAEIIVRMIKIGVIYLFVGPTGWQWFQLIVVSAFKNGTDYITFLMATSFDNSPQVAHAVQSGNYYDKSILFSSVDQVFGMFFSRAVLAKVSALLFASIFGFIYLYIIYLSFFLYVYAVANAVLLYLTAQVFISILFILGPIFFIFLLFNQTKNMFDNWLKALIGFSLQQIFLLTTLAFFNMMMYEVLKMSLGYRVCWDDVWVINIITRISLMSWWTVASLPPRINPQSQVGNIGNSEGIPSLFSILYIWIIASLMNKFVQFMTDLASSISGGIRASSLADGLKHAAANLKHEIMTNKYSPVAQARAAINEKIAKLDDKLFDSGSIAEDHRRDQQRRDKIDGANKLSLRQAANAEESKYRKENAVAFAQMSKEKQEEKIKSVRDTAMKNKATELGLRDEDLKRLQSDTEFKYRGTNVFGAAAALAKQVKDGDGMRLDLSKGRIMRAMKDDEVKTGFSRSEIKQAMKDTDEKGREILVDAAKKGAIQVEKSGAEKVGYALGKVGEGFKAAGQVLAHPIEKGAKPVLKKTGRGLEVAGRTVAGTSSAIGAATVGGVTIATTTALAAATSIAGNVTSAVVGSVQSATGIVAGTVGGVIGATYGGFSKGSIKGAITGARTGAVKGFKSTSAAIGAIAGASYGTVNSLAAVMNPGFKKSGAQADMAMTPLEGLKKGWNAGFKENVAKTTFKATSKAAGGIVSVQAKVVNSKAMDAAVQFSKAQLKQTYDAVSSADHRTAVKQLEDQGRIKKFMPGAAMFGRSSEEKAMIEKQIKQNREQREIQKPNFSSVNTAAYLEKRAEVENAKARGDEKLGIRQPDTLSARVFGQEKLAAAPATRAKRYFANDAKAGVLEARRKAFEGSIKSQLKTSQDRQDTLKTELAQFREGLSNIEQHDKMKQMKAIRESLADPNKSSAEIAKLKSEEKALSKDSTYQEQERLAKGASVAIQQHEIELQNNDHKLQQLQSADAQVDRVGSIRDYIEQNKGQVDPKLQKAANDLKGLDGSVEAYEQYANKHGYFVSGTNSSTNSGSVNSVNSGDSDTSSVTSSDPNDPSL